MALHLPMGLLKTRSGLERYRDANPIPIGTLADDIATAPSGPVFMFVSPIDYHSIVPRAGKGAPTL